MKHSAINIKMMIPYIKLFGYRCMSRFLCQYRMRHLYLTPIATSRIGPACCDISVYLYIFPTMHIHSRVTGLYLRPWGTWSLAAAFVRINNREHIVSIWQWRLPFSHVNMMIVIIIREKRQSQLRAFWHGRRLTRCSHTPSTLPMLAYMLIFWFLLHCLFRFSFASSIMKWITEFNHKRRESPRAI